MKLLPLSRKSRKIAKLKTKDEGEIRKIVIEIAANLNINLSQDQIDQIVELMKRSATWI